jgi:ketosteroid isomerase-like protein
MRMTVRHSILGLTVLGMLVAAQPAVAAADTADRHGGGHGHSCAARFDEAQRADMESFRDYDAATFRAGHAPDAVSIFPQGQRFAGIDAIMTALASHFADREAIWSWTEIARHIDGCRTAFIEYEAVYEIPRTGFYQRALTAVTYIYEHGRWLSILDQGTLLELRTGPAT